MPSHYRARLRLSGFILFILILTLGLLVLPAGMRSPVSALQVSTSTPRPTPVPGANLALEKGLESQLVDDLNNNGAIDPGDTIRYFITYRNTGTVVLSSVRIVDTYDDANIASIANITSSGVDNKDSNTIDWEIGALRPGTGGTITYEAKLLGLFPPQGSRRLESLVKMTSDQTDEISAAFSADVRIPKLSVSKSRELISDADKDGQADAGDKIRYTIKVRNEGNVEAVNVLVVDNYDQNLLDQPASISDPGSHDGDVIRWNLATLDKANEVTLTYETTVKLTLPVGKNSVKNTVTVSSDGTSPITAEHTFEVVVIATPTPTGLPEQLPTNTPEPAYVPAGPSNTGISGTAQAWLAFGFIALALGGMIVLGYLTYLEKEIPSFLRDGYILSLVMVSVVILGLVGSVERSAIAGLIGTVAGYILKGAVDQISKGTEGKRTKKK